MKYFTTLREVLASFPRRRQRKPMMDVVYKFQSVIAIGCEVYLIWITTDIVIKSFAFVASSFSVSTGMWNELHKKLSFNLIMILCAFNFFMIFFIAFKLFKRRNVSMPAGGPEDFAGGNLHDNTVSSTPYTVSIMQF